MEPGIVAAAYTAETAVEGAAGAAVAVGKGTQPLTARWTRIPTDISLPVSSHSLSIVKGKAYIFGGEEGPRKLVTNDVHILTLPQTDTDDVDYQKIAGGRNAPKSRIGHSSAVIDDRIYVYGGLEGSKPIDEAGRVWVFDTTTNQWSHLDPAKGSSYPTGRVYHSSVASTHPAKRSNDQPLDPLGNTAYIPPVKPSDDETEDPLGAQVSTFMKDTVHLWVLS